MKFKVNDRVSVEHYGCVSTYGDNLLTAEGGELFYKHGTVQHILKGGTLLIKYDDKNERSITATPRQCRKLVKKERRKVFIPEFIMDALKDDCPSVQGQNWISLRSMTKDDIEFVEVKRK